MFKRTDVIIFTFIALALGFVLVRQFLVSKEVRVLVQPENNQVLALEVARLTKANADLRNSLVDLENRINNYQKSASDRIASNNTLNKELLQYQEINGAIQTTGRGIELKINKQLTQPQEVDLANTIRNIGVDGFMINDQRIGLNYHFDGTAQNYDILIVGNSTLVSSALTRKGGFLDQLFPSGNEYSITEMESITLKTAAPINFIYAQDAN